MNPFRRDGLGWTAVALLAFGLIIVLANALDVSFWLFSVFNAIPMIFGLIVLACGLALILAGLFSGREVDEEA